ncbi:MAG: hypothetical protein ACM3JG_04940 [Thiohalocapsa sp.]
MRPVSSGDHLEQIDDIWYYRRTVPPDARHECDGKTKILPSRDQALIRFAERVELRRVCSVVTALSQTLRYGTPLAQALQATAAEPRDESLARLEKQTR